MLTVKFTINTSIKSITLSLNMSSAYCIILINIMFYTTAYYA